MMNTVWALPIIVTMFTVWWVVLFAVATRLHGADR